MEELGSVCSLAGRLLYLLGPRDSSGPSRRNQCQWTRLLVPFADWQRSSSHPNPPAAPNPALSFQPEPAADSALPKLLLPVAKQHQGPGEGAVQRLFLGFLVLFGLGLSFRNHKQVRLLLSAAGA